MSNQEKLAPNAAAQSERAKSRALLLVNRNARRGRDDIGRALARLREGGFELIETPTDRPSDLLQAIRSCRDKVDSIVIGGGDGTLSQAADALVEVNLPLGILPLGTANDLARTLGLPSDLSTAADVILQGHRKRIDLGWVNGTHFFNVASIGLTTGLTRRMSRRGKSRWGVLAYAFAAISVAVRARPFSAEIRTENETLHVRAMQIAVGNGRHYGGGQTIDENARIDDGQLNLVSLEIEHWWQLIPLLRSLRTGSFTTKSRVRNLQGRQFEVRVAGGRRSKIIADGELTSRTPAMFRIVPSALDVFVPEEVEVPGP